MHNFENHLFKKKIFCLTYCELCVSSKVNNLNEVYLFLKMCFSPNIDQVGLQPGVFGDALTAALDVIAFSHDIDVKTGNNEAPNPMNQNLKMPNAQSQVIPNGQAKTMMNGQQRETIGIPQNTPNNYSSAQLQTQNKSLTAAKPLDPKVTDPSKIQLDSGNNEFNLKINNIIFFQNYYQL